MPLNPCHRSTAETRELCRYESRHDDARCHRCVLQAKNPPQRKPGAWFNYRAELAEIRKEVAHRPIQPDKGTPE